MKILQINQTYRIGSTGKIMHDLNSIIDASGNEGYMLCGYAKEDNPHLYKTGWLPYDIDIRKNILESRITGTMGYGKRTATLKAIRWIESVNPDVIHLHNIHGNWINIKMLMEYIKRNNKPIVWTLHDCWAFTGRCSHFENICCEKWKTGCFGCENRRVYPVTYFFDRSRSMWKDKKEWFAGISNLNIVTPSKWLAKYVEQSYLGKNNIHVINNGIDLGVFKPSNNSSRYLKNCQSKKIVLGVANSWGQNKGLFDFYKLNEMLDASQYQIVLVGLNTRQMRSLPKGIIGIGRTNNVQELVELYSSADVFVNPTYLDNYPTVNLEAIACGVPVVTYRTGGSPESANETSGFVVEQGNIVALSGAIEKLCLERIEAKRLLQYAQQCFSKNDRYMEYIDVYKRIVLTGESPKL